MNCHRIKKRLGNMLVEEGVITAGQLEYALSEQTKRKQRLGELLVDLGYTDEITIAQTLRAQLGMDFIRLAGLHIEEDIVNMANEQVLRKHRLIPFEISPRDPSVLRIAVADPLDFNAIDDMRMITNMQIEAVIATPGDIIAAIDRFYGNKQAEAAAQRYNREKEKQIKEREEDRQANNDISQSPIVILVNTTIEQAIRQRASDIHIEPMEREIRVRYRIDGSLYEAMRYEINLLSAIVTRIKIISNLDISEKRNPQDGRITMQIDRLDYDIRVSILPTVFGEKIVMRIASKRSFTKTKKDLGFTGYELECFNSLLSNPFGIILVTGPTGSGKSTTLYTAISELNKPNVNIITVEDPVEATIEGINQVQVNTKTGLSFANVLRSILRQDPNIIMIGEIRDSETASIAVRASITGHLVISTLHTNNASSTINRLIDMGIEPYLLADAVIGIIAQRLIRVLCPACKKPRQADDAEKELLGIGRDKEQIIYEASGCILCNNTGYHGRTGVFEIMKVTDSIRELISHGGSSKLIDGQAVKEGMSTLQMSAIRYVREGITSICEMKKLSFKE